MIDDHTDREAFHHILADVRQKLSQLDPSGPISAALVGTRLEAIAEWIEQSEIQDLNLGEWPPLYLFVFRHTVEQLRAFDADVALVVAHTAPKRAKAVTEFLRASPAQDRLWTGQKFEVFIKSRLLKVGVDVAFDVPLPNGKEPDVRLELNGVSFFLECTVLTDSNEDRSAWARFLEAFRKDANTVMIRPGEFDPPDARGPAPAYDCIRLYGKVFDKMAPCLNPSRSQMSPADRNLLLICMDPFTNPWGISSPGVGWAFDELFAAQPRGRYATKGDEDGSLDIRLPEWLEFQAKDLCARGKLDWNTYCENFTEIISAPRSLGGILLFDGCSLTRARVNYNAREACRPTHRGIAQLEDILQGPPEWSS
jgi:hypothetical protein